MYRLEQIVNEVMKFLVPVESCGIYPDTTASIAGTGAFISMTQKNGNGKHINLAEFAFKCKAWVTNITGYEITTTYNGSTVECQCQDIKVVEKTEYMAIILVADLMLKKLKGNTNG